MVCRTMSFHFFLFATNSLHPLTPSTWRSLSTSSFHLFLGLLISYSSWVKIFLGILSSSILSKWPNQLILCPFNHFTIFSSLLISSSSRFVWLFHSPFSFLGPYILLNIFLSKISISCPSFFNNVHASTPYDTTGLISILYNIILVALNKSQLLKRLIAANVAAYTTCKKYWICPQYNTHISHTIRSILIGDCICSHKYTLFAQEIITSNIFYCITKQRLNNSNYFNYFLIILWKCGFNIFNYKNLCNLARHKCKTPWWWQRNVETMLECKLYKMIL